MDWYVKELLRDRRFKVSAGVAGASLVLLVLCAILAKPWSYRVAAYGFFPLFLLSFVAVCVVLGVIVRADFLQRKGHR